MPLVVKASFAATATGLTTIPIVPPPTPIPELWNGLQYFLAAYAPESSVLGQYPPTYPNVSLQNQFYTRWLDASGVLATLSTANLGYAHRTAAFDMSAWFPYSANAAHLINGKPVRTTTALGTALRLADENNEFPKPDALTLSPTYTIAIVYKADANCRGALLGAGSESVNEDHVNAGWRFGFKGAANGGLTIWQHGYNDRLDIARNTASGAPVVAIITGTNLISNVYLKTGGSVTNHPKTFAALRNNGGAVTHLVGVSSSAAADAAATERRSIAMVAQWNREITGQDLTYLKSWLDTYYGPF